MKEQYNIQLKGRLCLYMRWPLILSVLLVAVNIWIYIVDIKAGIGMSIGVLIYILAAGGLYFYHRSTIFTELVEFAEQYGKIQDKLLSELPLPYALLLEIGQLIWQTESFQQLIQG